MLKSDLKVGDRVKIDSTGVSSYTHALNQVGTVVRVFKTKDQVSLKLTDGVLPGDHLWYATPCNLSPVTEEQSP